MARIHGFWPSPSVFFNHRSFNHPIESQSRNPQLQNIQISTRQSTSETSIDSQPTTSNLSQLADQKKKRYIWLNPKISTSSKFRQKTYDSKHNSLTKVADYLNACSPVDKDVFNLLETHFGSTLVERDGLVILNNMSNPETARIVLNYFLCRSNLRWKLVLYNVTLKVFRKCKDFYSAEELFDEMLQRGIAPDNVTFSTIIGCARMCFLPGKAAAWFERMPEFNIQPDDATFAVMIDAYGRVGNVNMALKLYTRARLEDWRISAVTFTTVIRIYGTIGNFDECLNVFCEMKAHGINPNLTCYNTLLDAITRAKRPLEVKSIHQEILCSGLRPGLATYAALLRAYCKARYPDDAMNVYKEMKAKGMVLNNVLYNTLLSLCVDVGLVDEATAIFEDMKTSKDHKPDSRSFSLLITTFSRYGKVIEAEATFKEMLEAGFRHDIYVMTNMIRCYAKSSLGDNVVRMFDTIMEADLALDTRYCSCLLKVMTDVSREDLGMVIRCVDKADVKLGNVVKLVAGSGGDDETLKNEVREMLAYVGGDAKETYCSCLTDLCVHLEMPEKASYFRTLI